MQTSPVPVYIVGTHRISCDDENKVLIIDSLSVIRFSFIRYKLIKPLVEYSPVPVSNADLVQAAYASENWRERLDSLEKHFDNIRSN